MNEFEGCAGQISCCQNIQTYLSGPPTLPPLLVHHHHHHLCQSIIFKIQPVVGLITMEQGKSMARLNGEGTFTESCHQIWMLGALLLKLTSKLWKGTAKGGIFRSQSSRSVLKRKVFNISWDLRHRGNICPTKCCWCFWWWWWWCTGPAWRTLFRQAGDGEDFLAAVLKAQDVRQQRLKPWKR